MAKRNKTRQKNNNVPVGGKGNKNKQNPNKNKKQKEPPKGKKQVPKNPAYSPSTVLEGPALRRSIQEQIKAAIAPTLRIIGLQGQQLGQEETTAFKQEANRGKNVIGNIGNYYEKLAAEEAARIAAQSGASATSIASVQAAAQQASAGLSQGQQAIAAGTATANPEGGESKDALIKAMAEQQGDVAKQGQALVANAAGSGQNWNGLLTALAGSSGIRGGETIGAAGKEVTSNLNTLRNEYGKQRTKLKDAKLELLKERPELFKKLYNEAIERERNYGLSRATLGLEKEKVGNEVNSKGESVQYAKVAAREQLKAKLAEIKAEEGKRARELNEIGASEAEKTNSKQEFRREELKAIQEEQERSGGSGGGKNKPYEGYQTLPKTVSYLRGLINEEPKHLVEGVGSKTAKQTRKAAYDKLVNFGASPQVAKAAIKKLIKQYKKAKYNNTVKKATRGVLPG